MYTCQITNNNVKTNKIRAFTVCEVFSAAKTYVYYFARKQNGRFESSTRLLSMRVTAYFLVGQLTVHVHTVIAHIYCHYDFIAVN